MAIIYLNRILNTRSETRNELKKFRMGYKKEIGGRYFNPTDSRAYETSSRKMYKKLPSEERHLIEYAMTPEPGSIWWSIRRDAWVLFRKDGAFHSWELESKLREHLLTDAGYALLLNEFSGDIRNFVKSYVGYVMVTEWEWVDQLILNERFLKQHLYMEFHL